ncbi:hypothetical protein [Enterococcus faecium]|uniref:hypothetical protein n=1 Tax=Enterococcus faecium TaxID=1352 RepID=UPI0002A3C844|nr:hypothetical protein [Enterococcus faecium]ELA59636.1 hypothetical protein OGG_03489 [Enterococcus faecium EnGen0013]
MSNLENKEEKVVNKIVSVVNKLDKELDELDKSSPDSCVKCYTMFLPFLLIKIDVFS